MKLHFTMFSGCKVSLIIESKKPLNSRKVWILIVGLPVILFGIGLSLLCFESYTWFITHLCYLSKLFIWQKNKKHLHQPSQKNYFYKHSSSKTNLISILYLHMYNMKLVSKFVKVVVYWLTMISSFPWISYDLARSLKPKAL